MEVVTACVSKLGGYMFEPIKNQALYLFCFDDNVKRLMDEESKLKFAKGGIEEKVKREEDNTKEIEKEVKKWLEDVENVMADVGKLKEEIDLKKRCFNGLCPNWGWRYRLSREASNTTSRILELRDSGKFSTVGHLKLLPGIEFSVPSDFMSFKATELASEEIIKALKNEKTKMVGLYGAGGAGKTTLATVVGNELKQQKIFDEVVVAVVSEHQNFINVQKKLAESLRLELKEETLEERAKRLYLRFTETKSKILVILDDVWREFDLKNKLGIPVDGDHNGCKILLTTRRKHVCDSMRCDSLIQLGFLTQEEGLSLLKRYAGIGDDDYTVAKEIVSECKGLPLAIRAVGSALRGKNVHQWEAASRQLKRAELIKVPDIDKDIYACLKLSYDYVNEEYKLCFLLCSLFPEDYEIDLEDLVRYRVGWGCYPGVESIKDFRIELRSTIKGLVDSSLLLETGKEGFVKMHDVVRDVALWIGSEEKKFFSKAGFELTKWPEDERLEQYTGISLAWNSEAVLPNGLECPNLHILILRNEDKGRKFDVPDQFFEGMKELKVVTIIGGELSLKSLKFLTNLRVLQLIDCHVRDDLAFLEKLKTMQILCLEGTSYSKYIPTDSGDKLNELKQLHVGFSSGIKIHPVVLTRFSRLQEFYGTIWCDWTRSQTSFPKLSRYDIQNEFCYDYISDGNRLRMKSIEATSLVIFSALYENLHCLKLDDVSGCENIVPRIDQGGLNELTSLVLRSCKDLEYIMGAPQPGKSLNRVMPSKLETLKLIDLTKLQRIWKAPAQHVSLQHLTKVKVLSCHKLTYLFSLSQAQSLKNL